MTNNYNENLQPEYQNGGIEPKPNNETSQVNYQSEELTSNQNNSNIQTSYQASELTANNQNSETLEQSYQSNESKTNQNNEQSIKTENLTQQVNQTSNQNYYYNRNVDFSLPTTFEDYIKLSENFYAGFWQRFIAYIIDLIAVFSITGLFNTVTLNYLNVEIKLFLISEFTLSFVIVLFTYFILMTYFFSQTLGKVIMKIKVETNKGEKLSWSDVIYREAVGRILTIVLFNIPYLFVSILPKKKGLHDYIADTVAVKEDFSKLRKQMNEKIRAL